MSSDNVLPFGSASHNATDNCFRAGSSAHQEYSPGSLTSIGRFRGSEKKSPAESDLLQLRNAATISPISGSPASFAGEISALKVRPLVWRIPSTVLTMLSWQFLPIVKTNISREKPEHNP